ncbi:MAG: ferritin-like domain-containing protein [Ktedonobacteraceae bacterium]|nr:ferritin-like domain-containing protein [Ktedonobacteraceae bacterium]
MAMQNSRDLFIHEMSDMYDAEQRILQILPAMAQECNQPQVQNVLRQHEQETRQQILNLEQCFQILGAQPDRTVCYAIAGMKQEHDAFLKEQPPAELLTMFDLSGASKTEAYEIASYRGLIDKALLMGQQQCAQLLQQNLRQEEAMMQRVEQIGHQLGQQMAMQAPRMQPPYTGRPPYTQTPPPSAP